jgi:hypothetical protein
MSTGHATNIGEGVLETSGDFKEILLTKGQVALVDEADFDWLNQWSWHARGISRTWYAGRVVRTSPGRRGSRVTIYMHRLILGVGPGEEVDHRDGNGLNNRRGNLRVCSHGQNTMNSQKARSKTSQFKGVHWSRSSKTWVVSIRKRSGPRHIKYFKSEVEAAKEYDRVARVWFGEFARLNFPGDVIEPPG